MAGRPSFVSALRRKSDPPDSLRLPLVLPYSAELPPFHGSSKLGSFQILSSLSRNTITCYLLNEALFANVSGKELPNAFLINPLHSLRALLNKTASSNDSSPTLTVRPAWGFFCAIAAQVIWGGFPYFYNLLKSVDAFQLVAHRCIWGFVFVSMALGYFWLNQSADKRPVQEFVYAISNPRTLKLLVIAALLSGINWISFVWAVTHDRVLEASFGYYMCPQVHVFLGVVILGERLNGLQWLAVLFSAFGVIFIAVFSTGIPWIALTMATSFALYGLVKKKVPIGVVPNLTLETAVMLVPAVAYLVYCETTQSQSLIQSTWWINLLIVFSGLLTVTPLALYGTAVRHIPLSMVGLLQFIGPTLQFLSGVFLLGETFDWVRMVGFVFVWIGLVIFLVSNRPWSRPAT